jgi:putative transposase
MKRLRFSEEQIIGVLREHEAGVSAAEQARKHGISQATLYHWKAKVGGLVIRQTEKPYVNLHLDYMGTETGNVAV